MQGDAHGLGGIAIELQVGSLDRHPTARQDHERRELSLGDFPQARALPAGARQKIRRMGEAEQTVHEYLLEGSDIVDVARRLSRDALDHREQVLHAMRQFTQQEFVVLLGFLAFGYVRHDVDEAPRLAVRRTFDDEAIAR